MKDQFQALPPYTGLLCPVQGPRTSIVNSGYGERMGEDPKGPPKPTKARFALAANLKELMAGYQHGWLRGITPVQLEEGSGISAKTIRRLLDPYNDISPNLDTLDAIAAIFNVETGDLLKPQQFQPRVQGKEKPKNPTISLSAAQHKEKAKKG